MKRPDGVAVIALYQLIMGFVEMCLGYIALWIAVIAGATSAHPFWRLVVWGGLGAWLFKGGALAVVAGIGLWQMRRWARWVSVALAILALPCFPLGTVIGALILWYLLREQAGVEWRAGAF